MTEPKKQKSGGGCFSKLLLLILLAMMGGLLTAVFFVTQAQNLTDLGGYGPAAKTASVRDLKSVLQNAIDRGNFDVPVTEAEINQWLATKLEVKQGGYLAEQFKLERFWVRLEAGHAELIMERSVLGKPFTTSMFFKVEKELSGTELVTTFNPSGGPYLADYPKLQKGGRLGSLVVPQGFLHLLMPSYSKVAALFTEETEIAFHKMRKVTFEKGRIVFDPREPEGDKGMPQTF